MGNSLFGYRKRMHTLLISNWLRRSKLNQRPLWSNILHRVHQEHGGYIDGGWHVSHWYWEIPRIRMMILDNGMKNGRSIPGWIFWFSDVWQRHFCQCLSCNPWSIPNLTKTKHQTRHSCMNSKVINEPCHVHLLLKRWSYFVLCQANFFIWSGGSHSFLPMIWIFSTCMQKWATMSAQKCRSNSKICQIPLCS